MHVRLVIGYVNLNTRVVLTHTCHLELEFRNACEIVELKWAHALSD